jgi:glyoxylase-like metal-dependent hydrolase (beta-lactamase superfamily II)
MVTERAVILEGLKQTGIAPEEVTHIFISPHHPDHTVNVDLFPNAEIVDFWGRYRGSLWQDHADACDIVPGTTVLRIPGHTEEDDSLIVRADDGTYVFTHLWWLENMTPDTDPLAWDQAKLGASRQKVLAIADWIIPGHGRQFRNPRRGQP